MAVVNTQTDVTLTPAQCAFVRTLAFEELKAACEALAEQAQDAAGALEGTGYLAGDDAQSTWQARIQPAVDVLDTVGWSVLGEPAGQEGGE